MLAADAAWVSCPHRSRAIAGSVWADGSVQPASPGTAASSGNATDSSAIACRTASAVETDSLACAPEAAGVANAAPCVSAGGSCHLAASRPAIACSKSCRLACLASRLSQARRTPAWRLPVIAQASVESVVGTLSIAGALPPGSARQAIRVGFNERAAADSAASMPSASPATVRRIAQPLAANPASPAASWLPTATITVSLPSRQLPARQAASCARPVASASPPPSIQLR